jgi:hypothetical protein
LVLLPYLFLCLDYPGFFVFYCTTQTSWPPVGFEPASPASDRRQILALDHAATGIRKHWTVQPLASLYTDWDIVAHS